MAPPAHLPDADSACIDVVELMTDYLEGALPADDATRLERHLETCPGCTDFLDQLRLLAGSLRGASVESLPPAVRDDLLAAFRDLRPRP